MIDAKNTLLYRKRFSNLLVRLRLAIFASNGCQIFPTDKALSSALNVSPVAFSSALRGCTSASGLFLFDVLRLLREHLSESEFISLVYDFLGNDEDL